MKGRPRNKNSNRKRHHSERFRGLNLLVERWSNAKAAHVAFHVGQGKSSPEVSKILGDGTSPETLRSVVKKWRLPGGFSKRGCQIVNLTSHKRQLLEKQAEREGISPEVFLLRICESVIADDLYKAVTEGR
jgi:transposase